MLHSVELSDYIQYDTVTVGVNSDIAEASELILNKRVSGVCVVDNDEVLSGMLSEIDCLRAGISNFRSDNNPLPRDTASHMLLHPIKTTANEDLFSAIHKIVNNQVSGLCVINRDNKLIGVLSELDCLRAILSSTYNDFREAGKVGDHMTHNAVTCSLDSDIVSVAQDMLREGHRRRPVTNSGRLVGQMTCRTIIAYLSQGTNNQSFVRQHMTKNVEACQLNDDIVSVASEMLKKGRRRRPVISARELIGQITCRKLLSVVVQFNEHWRNSG